MKKTTFLYIIILALALALMDVLCSCSSTKPVYSQPSVIHIDTVH
jgi:hypothetical protein